MEDCDPEKPHGKQKPRSRPVKAVDDGDQKKLLENAWVILKDSVIAPLKLMRLFDEKE